MIAVAPAGPGMSNSSVSEALAESFAKAGHRVVLVRTDGPAATEDLDDLDADPAAIALHLQELRRQMPQALKGMVAVIESDLALDLPLLLSALREAGIQQLDRLRAALAAPAAVPVAWMYHYESYPDSPEDALARICTVFHQNPKAPEIAKHTPLYVYAAPAAPSVPLNKIDEP